MTDGEEITIQLSSRLLTSDARYWLTQNTDTAKHLLAAVINEVAYKNAKAKSAARNQSEESGSSAGGAVRRFSPLGVMRAELSTPTGGAPLDEASIVPDQLLPFLVEEPSKTETDELLSAREAAGRLDISPATLVSWIAKDKVLGFRSAGRNYLVPSEQILGRKRTIPGIDRLLSLFSCHEQAWEFLDQALVYSDKAPGKRPIELLNSGNVDDVLEFASSYLDGFDP